MTMDTRASELAQIDYRLQTIQTQLDGLYGLLTRLSQGPTLTLGTPPISQPGPTQAVSGQSETNAHRHTLGEGIWTYVEDKQSSGAWGAAHVQPKTALQHLKNFLGAETPLADVSRDDIIRWRMHLNDGKRSESTVNKYLLHAGSMFRFCRDVQEWTGSDPTIRTKLKLHGNRSRLPLSMDEIRRARAVFARECPASRMELELLIHTGARLSEIHQLQVADVVLDAPVPYLDLEGVLPGAAETRQLKNDRSRRKVPIHPELLERLTRYVGVEMSDPAGLLVGEAMKSDGFSKKFTRLTRVFLKNKRQTLHSIRHTMSNELQRAQVPEYVINQLLGHAQQTMSTSQYGGHISLEVLLEAVSKVSFRAADP